MIASRDNSLNNENSVINDKLFHVLSSSFYLLASVNMKHILFVCSSSEVSGVQCCLDLSILQNMFLCVPKRGKNHTFLKQHKGEYMTEKINTIINIYSLSCCFKNNFSVQDKKMRILEKSL